MDGTSTYHFTKFLDGTFINVGYLQNKLTRCDYDVLVLVLEHLEDQLIGIDCERDTVLGWMSMDGPRTSTGPVDWIGLWERYILCWVGCPWIVLGYPEDQ